MGEEDGWGNVETVGGVGVGGSFSFVDAKSLITNSSERPIIERSNNRYFGNDLLGTCSLHFTCQQYKGSNVMITIICLKIVYH